MFLGGVGYSGGKLAPEWLVRLEGDDGDLRVLAEHLATADPNVKIEDDGCWLRYSRFDSLTDPIEVYESAFKLLGEIRGVAQLLGNDAFKVKVAGLAREDAEGLRHQYVLAGGVPSDGRFGMPTDAFISMIAVAEKNPDIADALSFYQRGTWFDLFKAWEKVRDGTDGRSNAWTTRNERSRFTNTVNNPEVIGDHARHGVPTGDPPPNPMSVEEARGFVGRLIKTWIDEENT